MKLSFKKRHLSISDLPETVLPDFTLLTGPNGAGKTHLLEAILGGAIQVEIDENRILPEQIKMFNSSSLVPKENETFSSESLRLDKLNLFNSLVSFRKADHLIHQLRMIARSYSLAEEDIDDPLFSSDKIEKIKQTLGGERGERFLKEYNHGLNIFETQVLSSLDGGNTYGLKGICSTLGRRVFELSESEFTSLQSPSWGATELFQQSFARLFVLYRDLYLENRLVEFAFSKGESCIEPLSESEFVEAHGPKPWEFVNHAFRSAGLDFRINAPNLNAYQPFTVRLTKVSTGVEVAFSALSSGEKVLMSLAFCIYYSNDRRQVGQLPKILLLDEVDAPLHPSMARSAVNTIQETLVSKFGINVIATTHSPSAIALSPEKSIFAMNGGSMGVKEVSKGAALNLLTVGVPTLSISFDGRRQVFVESPIDARLYEGIYRILKAKILSERSLEFIATGTRAEGGDKNTGCDNVKRLVQALSETGNISVFGLLDWDGRHRSEGRIVVLSGNKRNGIENLIFDPVPLGFLIIRNEPDQFCELFGFKDMSYAKLIKAEITDLQKMVFEVGRFLFESEAIETVESTYVGGLKLNIDKRFCTTDDHELEIKVLERFPFLKSIEKNRFGLLHQYVIEKVFLDIPDLIPFDFESLIRELLEKEVYEDVPGNDCSEFEE